MRFSFLSGGLDPKQALGFVLALSALVTPTAGAKFDAKSFFKYVDESCDSHMTELNNAGDDMNAMIDAAQSTFGSWTPQRIKTFAAFFGQTDKDSIDTSSVLVASRFNRLKTAEKGKYSMYCDGTAFSWVTTEQEGDNKDEPFADGKGRWYAGPKRRAEQSEPLYIIGEKRPDFCADVNGKPIGGASVPTQPWVILCSAGFDRPHKTIMDLKGVKQPQGSKLDDYYSTGAVLLHEFCHAVLGAKASETYGAMRCILLATKQAFSTRSNADSFVEYAMANLLSENDWTFLGKARDIKEGAASGSGKARRGLGGARPYKEVFIKPRQEVADSSTGTTTGTGGSTTSGTSTGSGQSSDATTVSSDLSGVEIIVSILRGSLGTTTGTTTFTASNTKASDTGSGSTSNATPSGSNSASTASGTSTASGASTTSAGSSGTDTNSSGQTSAVSATSGVSTDSAPSNSNSNSDSATSAESASTGTNVSQQTSATSETGVPSAGSTQSNSDSGSSTPIQSSGTATEASEQTTGTSVIGNAPTDSTQSNSASSTAIGAGITQSENTEVSSTTEGSAGQITAPSDSLSTVHSTTLTSTTEEELQTIPVTSASTSTVEAPTGAVNTISTVTDDSHPTGIAVPVLFGCVFCPPKGGLALFGYGTTPGVYPPPPNPPVPNMPNIVIGSDGTPSVGDPPKEDPDDKPTQTKQSETKETTKPSSTQKSTASSTASETTSEATTSATSSPSSTASSTVSSTSTDTSTGFLEGTAAPLELDEGGDGDANDLSFLSAYYATVFDGSAVVGGSTSASSTTSGSQVPSTLVTSTTQDSSSGTTKEQTKTGATTSTASKTMSDSSTGTTQASSSTTEESYFCHPYQNPSEGDSYCTCSDNRSYTMVDGKCSQTAPPTTEAIPEPTEPPASTDSLGNVYNSTDMLAGTIWGCKSTSVEHGVAPVPITKCITSESVGMAFTPTSTEPTETPEPKYKPGTCSAYITQVKGAKTGIEVSKIRDDTGKEMDYSEGGAFRKATPDDIISIDSNLPAHLQAWWRDGNQGLEFRYGDQAWNTDKEFQKEDGNPRVKMRDWGPPQESRFNMCDTRWIWIYWNC